MIPIKVDNKQAPVLHAPPPLDGLATAATSMGIIRLVIPIALDNSQASALLEPTPPPPLDDL